MIPYWFTYLQKNIPTKIDDKVPSMAFETFSFDRKIKVIMKKTHKQKISNNEWVMIKSIELVVVGSKWTIIKYHNEEMLHHTKYQHK